MRSAILELLNKTQTSQYIHSNLKLVLMCKEAAHVKRHFLTKQVLLFPTQRLKNVTLKHHVPLIIISVLSTTLAKPLVSWETSPPPSFNTQIMTAQLKPNQQVSAPIPKPLKR